MGCEDSELWITYQQNSRGGRPATTQLIELEFQSHKLNDLEDVLDHVFTQGWVESHYRSLAWWEKHDGTKLKNGERIDSLLKQGHGKCEPASLKLVIADCSPVLWISYVFLKSPNAHASVQRINLTEVSDPCGKTERLAHVANFVFKKGFLPTHVRSMVHWEDTCKKRIEEHLCVKDVVCDRGAGTDEDRPLRLVIGLDFAFVARWNNLEADHGSVKTTPLVFVERRAPEPVKVEPPLKIAPPEQQQVLRSESHIIPRIPSPSPEKLPPDPSPPLPSLPSSPSSSSSEPSSDPSATLESIYTLWTLHHMLFWLVFLLSSTAALYPRLHGFAAR